MKQGAACRAPYLGYLIVGEISNDIGISVHQFSLFPDANEIPFFQIFAVVFDHTRRRHPFLTVFYARQVAGKDLSPDFVIGVVLGNGKGDLLINESSDYAYNIPLR